MSYRRLCSRFICNDSASLLTPGNQERCLLLKDLSNRGAGVFGNFPLNVDNIVKINIHSPFLFDKISSKQARVVWCRKVDINAWESGLNFTLAQ